MIYWHVERRATCVYSQLKRCSSPEVASMIDEQRAERRLREMEGRRGEEEDAHVQASVRKQRARLSVVA